MLTFLGRGEGSQRIIQRMSLKKTRLGSVPLFTLIKTFTEVKIHIINNNTVIILKYGCALIIQMTDSVQKIQENLIGLGSIVNNRSYIISTW